MNKQNKQSRQFTIKQIISQRTVSSQEELRLLLQNEGFEVTQATLSRDIKELGIARLNTPEGMQYVPRPEGEDPHLISLLSYEVESIKANESLIVIKTLPGRAHGVAEIMDHLHHPEVLGTIAGDNTIFLAPTSAAAVPEIVASIRELITSGGS